MRLLLSLVAVASLAACSRNTEENTTGQAPPETGQVAPADTTAGPPATGKVDSTNAGPDTSISRLKPDSAKGGFDTTQTTTGVVDTTTGAVDTSAVTPPTTPPPTTPPPTTPPPTAPTTPDSSTGMAHDSM
jgi:hypothetical protein